MSKAATKPAAQAPAVKGREISDDEAHVLVQLSMSQIEHSEKARLALTHYLERVLEQDEVDDDQARAAVSVLRQAATSRHRELCNKVLTKYLGKFDAIVRPVEQKQAVGA